MPLLKTIPIDNNGCGYLWEVSETEAFLAAGILLSPHSKDRLLGMKSELHRRAFLSVRHLMALAGIQDVDLYYDPFGKPHLKDGTFISISHSFT
ncbi:MAG: 4'-phosphopantetheinyl transferase, partial [Flavobacteriaceae bacterium]